MPGAVLGADEVGGQHRVALLAVLGRGDERERRLVGRADHVRAREAVGDLRVLAEHAPHQRLGQHVAVRASARRCSSGSTATAALETSVHGVVVQTSSVSPSRSAPAGLRDRVADVDARVLDVLVALRDLVARERRAVARAVRDDLEALVEQVLVPQLLERPPDRLDVVRVERPVGIVEVDPVADPLGQPRPVLEELEHGRAALGVELRDPVFLDLVLGLDPELVLDGDLDRQAVAVPAALAVGVEALHRLVAREDVLEHARQHVVRAGPPVGRRRALVEDERRRALAAAQRLAVDVALTPALEDLLLELREVGVFGQRAVRRHDA